MTGTGYRHYAYQYYEYGDKRNRRADGTHLPLSPSSSLRYVSLRVLIQNSHLAVLILNGTIPGGLNSFKSLGGYVISLS